LKKTKSSGKTSRAEKEKRKGKKKGKGRENPGRQVRKGQVYTAVQCLGGKTATKKRFSFLL
jgi:hypothetical protein